MCMVVGTLSAKNSYNLELSIFLTKSMNQKYIKVFAIWLIINRIMNFSMCVRLIGACHNPSRQSIDTGVGAAGSRFTNDDHHGAAT